MTGKSHLLETSEQRAESAVLAGSRDRGEADLAQTALLTSSGWTSGRIADAFSVRETTVRFVAQSFYIMGAAIGHVSAPRPVALIIAIQLNYAIAQRRPLLSRILGAHASRDRAAPSRIR